MEKLEAMWPVLKFVLPIFAVYTVIVYWRIFAKAGEAGWKSLIPVYNYITLFDIFYEKGMLITWIVLSILSVIVPMFVGAGVLGGLIVLILMLINCVFGLYINIKLDLSIAESFSKNRWFAVGLVFLYPVFLGILAFGKCECIGVSGGMSVKKESQLTGWRCECGNMNGPGVDDCDRCGKRRPKQD